MPRQAGAFTAPHAPYQATKEYLDRYQRIADPARRAYAAMITAMDDQIGRVLQALETRKMRENTLVVFQSDNGGPRSAKFTGEVDMSKSTIPADNGPYRDGKGTLYEGGTRVVALANWPGRISPGSIVDQPLHIVDMYPTLAKLAGVSLGKNKSLDGMDVWTTISAGQPSPREEVVYDIEPFRAAIRKGDRKLVWQATLPSQVELFNVAEDPAERTNLAATNVGSASHLSRPPISLPSPAPALRAAPRHRAATVARRRSVRQGPSGARPERWPISSESGTGKELVAAAIHRLSGRRQARFEAVNCGGLTRELLRSELFGHERGAFTGAVERHPGLLTAAHGGTVFLDEVGDLAPEAQVMLLRFLAEGEVRPVGAARATHADVRILAATHRDLPRWMREERFREDLFYRLRRVVLTVPHLRERPEDLPLLIEHFRRQVNARHRLAIEGLTSTALQRLAAYRWPGNVRELQALLEEAMILKGRGWLRPESLTLDETGESVGVAVSPVEGGQTVRGRAGRRQVALVWCPQRFFTTADLAEDHVGSLGPHESRRGLIVHAEVVGDGGDQFRHAAEGAPADALPRDLAEPALHHIEP
jgi:hypothetical protein